MTAKPQAEFLEGTCRQFLFSPKGAIEGVLMRVERKLVQVSMTAEQGAVLSLLTRPGQRLRVRAELDRSGKAAESTHPVYKFEALADAEGQALQWPATPTDHDATTITGIVAHVHFARHGQPNGVVLEGGEFIHLRPPGMAASGLIVGAAVNATGELRTTLLNTRMLEAQQVNGITMV